MQSNGNVKADKESYCGADEGVCRLKTGGHLIYEVALKEKIGQKKNNKKWKENDEKSYDKIKYSNIDSIPRALLNPKRDNDRRQPHATS